jgi:hypothetical protein
MMSPLREQQLADAIEKLIDDYGIDHFLSMSGFVAGEKAEHVAVNWQDTRRAKVWMEISAALDKLTAKAEEWKL